MPKFLMEARYTVEGVEGLAQEGGSARRDRVATMVASLGGTLEAFHYAFGEADVYLIVDLPDAASAAALAMAVNRSGAARLRTHALLAPEDVDAAARMPVGYRPPGQK